MPKRLIVCCDGTWDTADQRIAGRLCPTNVTKMGLSIAPSLAGLVRDGGILRRENADRIEDAWALYRSSADKPSGVTSTLFRQEYSYDPRIHFIGVWDAVGALGVPVLGPRWLKPVVQRLNRRSGFHDTALSTRVDGAFQALAIPAPARR